MRGCLLGFLAALSWGLSVGCSLPCPPSFRHETEPIEQSVEFGGAGAFHANLVHGSITIEGWDKPTAEMSARVWAKAYSEDSAKRLAESTTVELRREGERLCLACDLAEPLLQNEHVGVAVLVHLPFEAAATVSADYAGVSVSELAAPLDIRSKYGEVKLIRPRAPARCESKYGKVVLEKPSERVECRSVYGGIHVRKPAGPVDAHTKYGEVEITDAEQTVNGSSKYGDVAVTVAVGHWRGQPIQLETTYGRVSLDLPTASVE